MREKEEEEDLQAPDKADGRADENVSDDGADDDDQ